MILTTANSSIIRKGSVVEVAIEGYNNSRSKAVVIKGLQTEVVLPALKKKP